MDNKEEPKKEIPTPPKFNMDGEIESVTPKTPEKESAIRTYADDVASLIKSGTTLSDVALSEQKRRISEAEKVVSKVKTGSGGGRNKFVLIFAVILILLGFAVILGSFVFRGEKEPTLGTINIPSIIFSNSKKEVSLNELGRVDVLKKINKERKRSKLSLGAIENLYLTNGPDGSKTLFTAKEFLELIEIKTADAFLRSLENNFMLGVHAFDGNQGFLLFKIKSFDNALAEIINWEEFMLDDLWPMFYDTKPDVSTEEISSLQGKFKDIILKNRDARVLEDKSGETAIIYSFPDRSHLIITTEKSTMTEVFDRLTTGRFQN